MALAARVPRRRTTLMMLSPASPASAAGRSVGAMRRRRTPGSFRLFPPRSDRKSVVVSGMDPKHCARGRKMPGKSRWMNRMRMERSEGKSVRTDGRRPSGRRKGEGTPARPGRTRHTGEEPGRAHRREKKMEGTAASGRRLCPTTVFLRLREEGRRL